MCRRCRVVHVVSGNGPGMKVYIRGNPATKGDDAPKGFLQVLPSEKKPARATSPRLDLANADRARRTTR